MELLGSVYSGLKSFYNGINPATLSGAIDVIVVRQPDGTLRCTPFHVRFGKISLLRIKETVVDIDINGARVGVKMKVGPAGEAFFVSEHDGSSLATPELATSPLPDDVHMPLPSFDSSAGPATTAGLGPPQHRSHARLPPPSSPDSSDVEACGAGASGHSMTQQPPLQQPPVRRPIAFQHKLSIRDTRGLGPDRLVALLGELGETPLVTDLAHEMAGPLLQLQLLGALERLGLLDSDAADPAGAAPAGGGSSPAADTLASWEWGNLPSAAAAAAPATAASAVDAPAAASAASAAALPASAAPRFLDRMRRLWSRGGAGSHPGDGVLLREALSGSSTVPSGGSSPGRGRSNSNAVDLPVPHASSDGDDDDDDDNDADDDAENEDFFDVDDFTSMLVEQPRRTPTRMLPPPSAASHSAAPAPPPLVAPAVVTELPTLTLSLCGPLGDAVDNRAFALHAVSADAFAADPAGVLSNPRLVARLGTQCFSWPAAAALLAGMAAFEMVLPQSTLATIRSPSVPPLATTEASANSTTAVASAGRSWGGWIFRRPAPAPVTAQAAASLGQTAAAPAVAVFPSQARLHELPAPGTPDTLRGSPVSLARSATTLSASLPAYSFHDPAAAGQTPRAAAGLVGAAKSFVVDTANATPPTTAPVAVPGVGTPGAVGTPGSAASSAAGPAAMLKPPTTATTGCGKVYAAKQYAKTLYLAPEQLAALNLKPGANTAAFSFASKLQGKTVVSCSIYLWEHTDKVVVSDIDGTITKSDVMGHAAAILGRDWTHGGVAKLYSAIAANGYRFLYLSSRSISHAYATRGYLRGVRQDQTATLPDGPVLLSPESFINSIHREVIARAADQFKVPCLLSVLDLFPGPESPFVAGFGNRPTDVLTYEAVRVPADRIFTIDPKGRLRLCSSARTSSYTELGGLTDHYFPPLRAPASAPTAATVVPVPPSPAATPAALSREFTTPVYWSLANRYASVDVAALEKSLASTGKA